MATTTKPRAPRTRQAVKVSQDAAKVDAKVEATKAAQAAKVEAAEAATVVVEASLSDRQARYVSEYRSAEADHGTSKHRANVAAVAFFRTLPESETVTTNKSQTVKPVGAIERARRTLEALCVKVERNDKGQVVKGSDTIAFTPQRLTQLVDAFTNAERTSLVKVEALANGDDTSDAEQVEALVSAFDQAAVVGGKRAAEALASKVREDSEERVAAEAGEISPLAAAVESARADVVEMREAKKEQAKTAPVVKTAAQIVGDAVQVLWEALEAEAQNLDAGQKSAMLAKVNEMSKFLK